MPPPPFDFLSEHVGQENLPDNSSMEAVPWLAAFDVRFSYGSSTAWAVGLSAVFAVLHVVLARFRVQILCEPPSHRRQVRRGPHRSGTNHT